ncbi:MAG: nuclease-related domain-containing protein [Ilumatobacteraceae bacterium]
MAGAGPQAEYERRTAKRQKELDAIPGLRGKLVRALDKEPQSTTAWAKGAEGERRLASTLEAGLTTGAVVLHSRKVPKTRGDIDHLIRRFVGDLDRRCEELPGPSGGPRRGWLADVRRPPLRQRSRQTRSSSTTSSGRSRCAVLDPMGFRRGADPSGAVHPVEEGSVRKPSP